MDYPNEFDTPAFPAGKTIALSRGVSVWISVVLFLIVCMCGFILLCKHYTSNYPFLISVDPFTDEWTVVAFPNKNSDETVQQYQIIQEKLANDFVTNWFTISANSDDNDARWKKCSIEDCDQPDQFAPGNIQCAISCQSDDMLFEQFSTKILPEYRARFTQGPEQWRVGNKDIKFDYINENGGRWQVYADVYSNINGRFKILAFITIDRDTSLYPATLGYYVKDFNSYRMAQ